MYYRYSSYISFFYAGCQSSAARRRSICYSFACIGNGEKVTYMHVVRDYADVFSEKLPGFPPERDNEFSIILEPKAQYVSKSPLRMDPKVLAELWVQLEDLIKMGFI